MLEREGGKRERDKHKPAVIQNKAKSDCMLWLIFLLRY